MNRPAPQGARVGVARRSHRWGGLLWQRDFRQLWIGETTSSVGNAVTVVALPLVAVTSLHAGTFTLGVLYAAAWVPWLVMGLPAGAWVDRFPRVPVMVACDAVSIVALVSVPVAAWCGVLHVAQLVAVALVIGTASVFFTTAYSAFLPSLIVGEDLLEGNTKLQGSRSAAQIAGPGIAGVVAQLFGAVTALLADAVTFGVSAVCLIRIRSRESAAARPGRPVRLSSQISTGLRFIAADPYLRLLAVQGAVGNLAITGWQTLEVVFLVRVVGLNPAGVGVLLGIVGVGGVIGALAANAIAQRAGTARGLLLCTVGTSPFALLVPLTGPGLRLILFAAGGAITSAGIVAGNVIARSFQQLYCPTHLLGRVMASARTLSYGVIPLGALLAGESAAVLGIRTALWIATSLLLASATILLRRPIRAARELPTQPATHGPQTSDGDA